MDKDKQALWLQFIGCCTRVSVDPVIVFQRDKYKGEMYEYARGKLLREVTKTFSFSKAAKLTGYTPQHLRRLSK